MAALDQTIHCGCIATLMVRKKVNLPRERTTPKLHLSLQLSYWEFLARTRHCGVCGLHTICARGEPPIYSSTLLHVLWKINNQVWIEQMSDILRSFDAEVKRLKVDGWCLLF